jgi:hypothetical protein
MVNCADEKRSILSLTLIAFPHQDHHAEYSTVYSIHGSRDIFLSDCIYKNCKAFPSFSVALLYFFYFGTSIQVFFFILDLKICF